MEIHRRKSRYVPQQDEYGDHKGTERKVVSIGHLHSQDFGIGQGRQGADIAPHLTADSNGIQNNEKCVPEPSYNADVEVDQIECIVRIPHNFRQSPCEQHDG